MMHFNPLNIVNLGGNKIQHPEATRSNTISRNVEAAHKDFLSFQLRLKNLVMLYKTRHQLIDSLNENGLYTARCYDEIFHDTPLSLILAPGQNSPATPQPPTAPSADESEFVSKPASLGVDKIDDIDTSEYPETSYSRRKLDAEEGSMIDKDVSHYAKEPEGVRASLYASIAASETASIAARDKVESQTTPRRRERSDPPSKAFPDDEIDAIFEKNPRHSMAGKAQAQMESDELGADINFIVDDGEDSFTNEQECKEIKSPHSNDENGDNDTIDEKSNTDGTENETNADNEQTRLSEPVSDNTIADEQEEEMVSFRAISADMSSEDGPNKNRHTPSKVDDEKDLNRVLTDHDMSVETMVTPRIPQSRFIPTSRAPLPDRFYFDIHKDAYKEINAKLADHSDLVAYVEKWEQIVTKRVQSAYAYYCKDRISLNHYAKKLDSLIEEDLKNKERNKPVKRGQMDKLERNQVKFESAEETHDSAGESLLMLIEELTLRSWRDAYPLLRKSIQFEGDFAAINQIHMSCLDRSLDLLDVIGQKESISMEGRLEDLEKLDPKYIYTG